MTDAQMLEALVEKAIQNGWPWVIKPMPDAIICVMPADADNLRTARPLSAEPANYG